MIYYKHTERMLCEILIKGVHYEEENKKIPAKSTGTANSRDSSNPCSLLNF